jgi:hypothetical protein
MTEQVNEIRKSREIMKKTGGVEEPGPFARFRFEDDEKTGKSKLASLELSDGTKVDSPENRLKFKEALKKTTGSCNIELAHQIIQDVSFGMTDDTQESRINHVLTLLPALRPENETEAMLLGQFVTLQQSGMRCLRRANSSESFYHIERLLSMSTKLFNAANATMQTLLKCRSGGRQEIQIVHLHNQGGQAIVTQNLSHGGGGTGKNQQTEPLG